MRTGDDDMVRLMSLHRVSRSIAGVVGGLLVGEAIRSTSPTPSVLDTGLYLGGYDLGASYRADANPDVEPDLHCEPQAQTGGKRQPPLVLVMTNTTQEKT